MPSNLQFKATIKSMIIKGEKVVIKPVEPSCVEMAYKWLNDEEIIGRVGFLFPPDQEHVARWIEAGMGENDAQRHFAIFCEKELLGFVGLRGINWQSKNAELWIFIGEKKFWGLGLGEDATKIFAHFSFHELGLYRLWVEVFAFNLQAIKMFSKVGFKEEGVWRKSYFYMGKYHDSKLLGLLKEEFVNS